MKKKPRGPGRPFEKGHNKGGRPKGCPNKIGNDVKKFVLDVAEKLNADPEAGLLAWARKNPGEFWTRLFPKLLPRPIDIEVTEKLSIAHLIWEMGPPHERERLLNKENYRLNHKDAQEEVEEAKLLDDRSGG